jgi:hypothetical protein
MTIPNHIKQPILRSFHVHTVTPGWHYDDSGPAEKDRQLLVEYYTVVEEVNRLLPAWVPLHFHFRYTSVKFTSSQLQIRHHRNLSKNGNRHGGLRTKGRHDQLRLSRYHR